MSRFVIALLLLPLFAVPAMGQFQSEWYWTEITGSRQLALWHNGVQVGGLELDTMTYYPRYAPGNWGVPEDPPCNVPQEHMRAWRKQHWKTHGVTGPSGDGKIPASGLHIRQVEPKSAPRQSASPPKKLMKDIPQSRLGIGVNEIPSYDTMSRITFVAKDGTVADNALKSFNTAPELTKWKQKYGSAAKAYSLEDFQHTGSAFKLDQDKQFAQTGFVALVQCEPPDADDKAVVHSIYAFDSATEFAAALRDADPNYDPNPPDGGVGLSEWQPWHYAAAGGIGTAILACIGGAIAIRRWA